MQRDAWNPEQYEKFKQERSQPFFDLLALVKAEPVPERAVDLGCGSGELTKVLHEKLQARETLGVDQSENMLAKAAPWVGSGLSFQRGKIEEIDKLGPFDLIFSNAALQWCQGHEKLFAQLRGALRPGGQLAVQVPMNHNYPTHLLARAMASEEPYCSWLQDEGGAREPSLLAPEAYASLLFRLGFREQLVLLKVYGHVLESREEVVEWVKGTLLTYYQSRLTAEQYQRFLADFRERLFRALPDEKPFFYPSQRLLLWGRI
jgi:trans-aconitate 2-methyltransferase